MNKYLFVHLSFKMNYERNPIEEMKTAESSGLFHYIPPGPPPDAEGEDEVDKLKDIPVLQPTSKIFENIKFLNYRQKQRGLQKFGIVFILLVNFISYVANSLSNK